MPVLFSNIRWQWTPNPYLASIIGVFAAFLVTVAINAAAERIARWRGRVNNYARHGMG
jgi:hypothetical protein